MVGLENRSAEKAVALGRWWGRAMVAGRGALGDAGASLR